MRAPYKPAKRQRGFTLIEIIVGLVIGTLAISLVATLIFPLYSRSVEPILQIRAGELAQALLDDAMARRYDETTPVGGQPPCTSPCSPTLGPDGESSRVDFDDVDDYDAFCGGSFAIQDIYGSTLSASNQFGGFSFEMCVEYDGNYDGVADSDVTAKLITVTVTPPNQAVPVSVSAYRANY